MRPPKELPDLQALEEVRREYTLHVLELCHGNGVRAARALGIDRKTLYRMLRRWRDGAPRPGPSPSPSSSPATS